MIKTFESYNKNIKSTIIITEVEQFKFFHFHELFKGKLKEIYEKYFQLVEQINENYKEYFCLPGETVAFSTQFAIKGENFELAKEISKILYDFIKSSAPKLNYQIEIGYGEVRSFGRTIHTSNGPVFWKVGRTIDARTNDGIEIIEGEWTEENMKNDRLIRKFSKMKLDQDIILKTIEAIENFNNRRNKKAYNELISFIEDKIKDMKEFNDKDYYMSIIWNETGLDHVDSDDIL